MPTSKETDTVTINLHISAESAKDFFTQLAEVSAGFYAVPQVSVANPVMPELTVAASAPEAVEEKPKRTRRTAAQIAADNAAQEPPAGTPMTEEEIAAVSGAEETSQPEPSAGTAEPESTSEPQADSSSSAPAAASDLDYDRDVAPAVLAAVKDKGKPFVIAALEQFGVVRASELAPEQYGELLSLLDSAA